MKKLITLIILSSSILFFGCKKDDSNRNQIDTTPKMVRVTFTNNNVSSSTYYTINDRTTTGHGLNGTFQNFKDDLQVKIGDVVTAHMFTGSTKPTTYSIKISYADKQLAYSDDIIEGNQTHAVEVTHTFTSEDFK